MQGLHSGRNRLKERRVMGMCPLGKMWGWLRSAARARLFVDICALVPPALEGWSVCVRWKTRGSRFARRQRSKGALVCVRWKTCEAQFARRLRAKGGWYMYVGKRVGLALLAACALRVVGMCALQKTRGARFARRLRSKGGRYVCV